MIPLGIADRTDAGATEEEAAAAAEAFDATGADGGPPTPGARTAFGA